MASKKSSGSPMRHYQDEWDELQKALGDTSVPRSQYIEALEEMVDTLQTSLDCAKQEEEAEEKAALEDE